MNAKTVIAATSPFADRRTHRYRRMSPPLRVARTTALRTHSRLSTPDATTAAPPASRPPEWYGDIAATTHPMKHVPGTVTPATPRALSKNGAVNTRLPSLVCTTRRSWRDPMAGAAWSGATRCHAARFHRSAGYHWRRLTRPSRRSAVKPTRCPASSVIVMLPIPLAREMTSWTCGVNTAATVPSAGVTSINQLSPEPE